MSSSRRVQRAIATCVLEWPIPKSNFEPKVPYLGLRPAKNQWVLGLLKDCGESVLPAKSNRKSAKGLWSLTSKLKNGLGKWRKWEDTSVRNVQGVLAASPEENAENFSVFFDDLFNNSQKGLPTKEAHKGMMHKEADFSHGPPTTWEMKRAIKGLKNAAPGR
jgi:hypothetical protein